VEHVEVEAVLHEGAGAVARRGELGALPRWTPEWVFGLCTSEHERSNNVSALMVSHRVPSLHGVSRSSAT
jgi:hypothetical protein